MGHRSHLVRTLMFIVPLAATFLSACLSQGVPGRGRPAATTASTLMPTPTQRSTATVIPTPTSQPTPSPTLAHKPSPTVTPTSSLTPAPSPPVTRTPAPPAECPKPTDQMATISPISPGTSVIEGLEPQILDYLNARGSADGLQAALNGLTMTDGGTTWKARTQVMTIDVTGDTTPDVVMDFSFFVEGQYADGAIFVFMCREGRYEGGAVAVIGGQISSSQDPDPGIRAIRDMNRDGVPEIIFSYIEIIGTHANFTRVFRILEWDGSKLVDLIQGDSYYPNAASVNNGDGVIRDRDGDGSLELVLTNGIGRGPEISGPQRPRTEIWAWNGVAFTLASVESASPEYRFQAVQDGDEATLRGDYDKALAFYQQATFDDQLLGWSPGQLWPDSLYGTTPTPTPDPDERPRLSAYARYRIMILYLVQGFMSEAQIVYETLQDEFPVGVVGHQYAELAALFWEEYKASEDIAAACGKAIEYASAHVEEVLTPLGSGFYGFGQRDYAAEDICPFE